RPHTTSDACGGRVDSTRCTDGQSRGRPMISSAGTALRRLFGGGLLAGILASALPAQSAAPRIALVLDQQAPRVPAQVAAFQRELQGFFRPGEITLLPPVAGDGTPAGVWRVLDQALRDSSVTVIVTLGPIGSHLVARAGESDKPAIAATIVDAGWQGIPEKNGSSGVRRLAYVDESFAVSGTIAA